MVFTIDSSIAFKFSGVPERSVLQEFFLARKLCNALWRFRSRKGFQAGFFFILCASIYQRTPSGQCVCVFVSRKRFFSFTAVTCEFCRAQHDWLFVARTDVEISARSRLGANIFRDLRPPWRLVIISYHPDTRRMAMTKRAPLHVPSPTYYKPAPSEIQFGKLRFLITDRPNDSTIGQFIEVWHFGHWLFVAQGILKSFHFL